MTDWKKLERQVKELHDSIVTASQEAIASARMVQVDNVEAAKDDADLAAILTQEWSNGPHGSPDFFYQVDSISCSPRGIHSLIGRAMASDIASVEGMTHKLFAMVDADLGLTEATPPNFYGYHKSVIDNERDYLIKIAGQWAKQRPGKRSSWWRDNLIDEKLFTTWANRGKITIKSKGIVIQLPPSSASYDGLVFGSPVDPISHGALPAGWTIALGFDEVYPSMSYIPVSFRGKHHTGADFNFMPEDYGKPLYACADGTIIAADKANPQNRNLYGWGAVVDIQHEDGTVSRYGHLSRIDVTAGESVQRGQIIGAIGDANNTLPSHLHFGISIDDTLLKNPEYWSAIPDSKTLRQHFTDPLRYINERGFWL